MRQPVDFIKGDNENVVCLLNKFLYGLKQASRQWYKRFDTSVLQPRLQRSNYDIWLIYKGKRGKKSLYLVLYVHDILFASYDKSEIEDIKQK